MEPLREVILDEDQKFDETPTCDWDLNGETCESVATHRTGFECCQDWSLLCTVHARWMQRWINLHSKNPIHCKLHGNTGLVKQIMRVLPL